MDSDAFIKIIIQKPFFLKKNKILELRSSEFCCTLRPETTENPLKMMKNAFYFTLKALFVLKIFKFLS